MFNQEEVRNLARLLMSNGAESQELALAMVEARPEWVQPLAYPLSLVAALDRKLRARVRFLLSKNLSVHVSIRLKHALTLLERFYEGLDWDRFKPLLEAYEAEADAFTPYFKANTSYAKCLGALAQSLAYDYNQREAAIRFYERAIACQPLNAILRYNFGGFLDSIHHRERVRDLYQEAIHLGLCTPYIYYRLARVYDRYFKNYEKATYYYEQALKLNPTHAKSLVQLAILYRQDPSNFARAKALLERNIQTHQDAEAYNQLALLYLSYEIDYDYALELIRKALERKKVGRYFETYATILLEGYQNIDEAIRIYKRAVREDYEGAAWEARARLGDIYVEHRQRADLAKRWYKKTLAMNPKALSYYPKLIALLAISKRQKHEVPAYVKQWIALAPEDNLAQYYAQRYL